MTLRTKTMLIVGATFVALLAVLYGSAHLIVMDGFLRLEQEAIRCDAERARDAILDRVAILRTKCADWAVWDDSYEFLHTRTPAFVESNLQKEALLSLDVNYIAFFDLSGELVAVQCVLDGGERPPEASFLAAFSASRRLRLQPGSSAAVSGMLSLPEGPLLFAARPVVNSHAEGPPRGSVLFARYLDDAAVQAVADVTHLTLNAYSYDNGSLPESGQQARSALAEGVGTHVQVVDDRWIAGWFVVDDVEGRPALLGRVTQPRSIVAMGRASLWYLLASLLLLGAGYALVTRTLLNRLVLSRIAALRDGVQRIGRLPDVGDPLTLSGRDELSDLADEINGMVATLARTQHDLRTAGVQAQEANRGKSEFLANMSHEIRTPMTAILGFTELLRDPALSGEERSAHVDTIRRNGEHLLCVINDILDLSKIEAGRMKVERIATSLVQTVEEVASLMRVRADDKGLRLETQWVYPLPRTIQTDPVRLRQILMNLVGNAIKFTDRGLVVVRAKLAADAPWPRIVIEVTDTGIGMTAVELSRLFQAFSQADGSTTRHFGGSGLGLAISQRLADMLGGTIEAVSQPGVGSTFTLSIDPGDLVGVAMIRSEAGLDARPPSIVAMPQADLSGCRLLLAEDGPDNQRLIGLLLRKAGAEVEVTDNGRDAHETALAARREGRPFDVVLMDMQMPVMDGYTAARLLRDDGYRGPIVALTAHAMSGDREKCLAAGCDDYATKPIDRARLLAAVAEWAARGVRVRAAT